jgi:hypothetical protein
MWALSTDTTMLPNPQAIDSIVTRLGKAYLARWRRWRRSGLNYLLDKLFQIAHSTVPSGILRRVGRALTGSANSPKMAVLVFYFGSS